MSLLILTIIHTHTLTHSHTNHARDVKRLSEMWTACTIRVLHIGTSTHTYTETSVLNRRDRIKTRFMYTVVCWWITDQKHTHALRRLCYPKRLSKCAEQAGIIYQVSLCDSICCDRMRCVNMWSSGVVVAGWLVRWCTSHKLVCCSWPNCRRHCGANVLPPSDACIIHD